jgi:hypothetical protein
MDRVHAFVDRPGALGPPWINGGVDRGGAGARWRAHWSSASGHSSATKLTGRGATERSARGARLGPHRGLGGIMATERRRWREEVTGNSAGRVSGAGEERRKAR